MVVEAHWLNLWWMAGGYLPPPDPGTSPRVLSGLAPLAWDLIDAGVRVRWGEPAEGKAACSYWWRNEIVLAAWLFGHRAEVLLYVLRHELGHCLCGRSCQRVQRWQRAMFPETANAV